MGNGILGIWEMCKTALSVVSLLEVFGGRCVRVAFTASPCGFNDNIDLGLIFVSFDIAL